MNPALYQLEYLGIPIGSGEEVFPNLVLVGTETLSSRVERSEIEGSTHYDGAKIPRLPSVARDDRVVGRLGGRPMTAPTGAGKALRREQAPALQARGEGFGGSSRAPTPTLPKASGVDWGWWPDPWAFNRVAYDAENRVLYILSELHCYRTGNRETGLMVKNIIPS